MALQCLCLAQYSWRRLYSNASRTLALYAASHKQDWKKGLLKLLSQ